MSIVQYVFSIGGSMGQQFPPAPPMSAPFGIMGSAPRFRWQGDEGLGLQQGTGLIPVSASAGQLPAAVFPDQLNSQMFPGAA